MKDLINRTFKDENDRIITSKKFAIELISYINYKEYYVWLTKIMIYKIMINDIIFSPKDLKEIIIFNCDSEKYFIDYKQILIEQGKL